MTSEAVTVNVRVSDEKQKLSDALTKRAQDTLHQAQHFQIVQNEDFSFAGKELERIAKQIAAIDAHRKDMTRPLDKAKNEIMDKFKPALALLTDAKSYINREMLRWQDELEQKRREEQRKLEEQARKERERLEREAQKAAEKGKADRAAELQTRAATTVAPVVAAQEPPKVQGVAMRSTWKAECTDVVALCKAIVEGKVAPIAVEPNMTFLNEQARSLAEHFNVPGCRAVEQRAFGRVRG